MFRMNVYAVSGITEIRDNIRTYFYDQSLCQMQIRYMRSEFLLNTPCCCIRTLFCLSECLGLFKYEIGINPNANKYNVDISPVIRNSDSVKPHCYHLDNSNAFLLIVIYRWRWHKHKGSKCAAPRSICYQADRNLITICVFHLK